MHFPPPNATVQAAANPERTNLQLRSGKETQEKERKKGKSILHPASARIFSCNPQQNCVEMQQKETFNDSSFTPASLVAPVRLCMVVGNPLENVSVFFLRFAQDLHF